MLFSSETLFPDMLVYKKKGHPEKGGRNIKYTA